jgi:transcriptional regulator with XRE-family HTH domain
MLKKAREAKGYTISDVSDQTNIAIRFLEGLEREDFSVFPGEAYALGFLKNYGLFLELDTNELLSLHRAIKIQEQPVPVEQLLRSPSSVPKVLAIIGIIILVLGLGAGGYWFISNLPAPSTAEPTPVRRPQEYTMNIDSMERRFYPGDTILVPLGNNIYKLELSGLSDTVNLATPTGPVRLDLSQEAMVDLDNDGIAQIRIIVADFARNDSNAGALLRFELSQLASSDVPQAIFTEEIGQSIASATPPIVLFNSPNAYPFTLQAVFQGYCLFRWEILFERDRPGRNEQYFQNSNELTIQAQNGIRLGLSNANAVRLQVIGGGRTVPLEAGGPGEVVVADLRWIRDEENRYLLVFSRLE